MILDIARLVVALGILCFHKPIGTFVLEHERRFATLLSERGVFLPNLPSQKLTHDLYFSIGAIASVACVVRLWVAHG
ncbi:MAG: hypothetical protein JWO13_99 [Acidobacteriales bacterium]|nr:hypothetical protein [Terriglobales bacterium]